MCVLVVVFVVVVGWSAGCCDLNAFVCGMCLFVVAIAVLLMLVVLFSRWCVFMCNVFVDVFFFFSCVLFCAFCWLFLSCFFLLCFCRCCVILLIETCLLNHVFGCCDSHCFKPFFCSCCDCYIIVFLFCVVVVVFRVVMFVAELFLFCCCEICLQCFLWSCFFCRVLCYCDSDP